MTKFDPKFALEVMRRRQSEKNKAAAEIFLEKFMLQVDDQIPLLGGAADEMDKRIHALWAEADSYNSVIDYLRERIWFEMTPDQRAWVVMESWDYQPFPRAMQDVDDARKIASEVDAWRTFG